MLMEVLLGVWLMNQHQGLLPSSYHTTTTTQIVDGATLYTRIGRYEILERVPHDTNAFTQGLVMIADTTTTSSSSIVDEAGKVTQQHFLYEGTGMYGSSQLRRLDIQTGNLLASRPLEDFYFGEGIAHYRDQRNRLHVVQLTWKKQRAFEYIFNTDTKMVSLANSMNDDHLLVDHVTSWRYQTTTNEGWGITYSPAEHVFYVTDGSKYIHVWNADTKKETHKVSVKYKHPRSKEKDQTKEITMLNELEYDPTTNTILANVWRENIIIRIDPHTGFVTSMYDLKNILPKQDRTWHTDVLNGIALTYDLTSPLLDTDGDKQSKTVTDEIWVTGKYWPYMFRIRLIDNSCTSAGIEDYDESFSK